jgi:hypothetical protein
MTNEDEAVRRWVNSTGFALAAETAYEANRLMCKALKDDNLPIWKDALSARKDSIYRGVVAVIKNPDITPKELHNAWLSNITSELYVNSFVKTKLFILVVRAVLHASEAKS